MVSETGAFEGEVGRGDATRTDRRAGGRCSPERVTAEVLLRMSACGGTIGGMGLPGKGKRVRVVRTPQPVREPIREPAAPEPVKEPVKVS